MGAIVSRFRKSQTTIEILEEIDKNIASLEKFRRANQELRQKVIGRLILYSVTAYILGAIAIYFFFMPEEWTYKIYGLLPFLLFPFLVYLLKRFLHWFFVRKISQNEGELQQLRDKRKDILENVMETETYKKAKEILEKFDPETKKKLEEEKNRKEAETIKQTLSANAPPGLRRRPVPTPGHQIHPGSPGVPQGRGMPMSPGPQTPLNGMSRGQNVRLTTPVAVLPRPILPLNKTPMDKLMDYMIGDGTSHRYALICQNCYSHNGMALKEEFEYLAFRCAYCRFFNPARKQRPNAPRLPTSSPRQLELKEEPDEEDSGSEPEEDATDITEMKTEDTTSKVEEIGDPGGPLEADPPPPAEEKMEVDSSVKMTEENKTNELMAEGDN